MGRSFFFFWLCRAVVEPAIASFVLFGCSRVVGRVGLHAAFSAKHPAAVIACGVHDLLMEKIREKDGS